MKKSKLKKMIHKAVRKQLKEMQLGYVGPSPFQTPFTSACSGMGRKKAESTEG